MILELQNDNDIEILENNIRKLLMASRFDISLLKSSAYINFKLKCIKQQLNINDSVYFFNENVWIRVLEKKPVVLIYCGLKELECNDINCTYY